MERSELGLKIGFSIGTLEMLKQIFLADLTAEQTMGVQKAIRNLKDIWEDSEKSPVQTALGEKDK